MVTFSRSISSKARTGSQRRIITSLPPPNSMGFSTAKQPVAWKNGTDSSIERCGALGSGAGGALAAAQEGARRRRWPPAMMLELTLRWVASAPFGFPVVPEV